MRKKALAAACLATLAGAVGLFALKSHTKSRTDSATSINEVTRPATPEEPLGISKGERVPVPGATLVNSAESQRTASFIGKLHALYELADRMPPHQGQNDFTTLDMRPLKELVLTLSITEDDITSVLNNSPANDQLRALALAALAYVPRLSRETKELVETIVRDSYPSFDVQGNTATQVARASTCHAGLFALIMRGAHPQVEAVALDLLQLYEVGQHPHELLRGLVTTTIVNLSLTPDPKVLDALRRASSGSPEMYLTSATFQALASSGTPLDRDMVVRLASGKNGFAREGLENVRDPAMIPTLTHLASLPFDSPSDRVTANYMALSAARGLLSIGSVDALAAFERIALSENNPLAPFAARALMHPVPPGSAGALALSASRVHQSGSSLAGAMVAALSNVRDRLLRCTVSDDEQKRCTEGLQRALPSLMADHTLLRLALETLASTGEDGLEADIKDFSNTLAEADKLAVQHFWILAHPLKSD
jgi:hypothetical protein